jgi:hypothetical protein
MTDYSPDMHELIAKVLPLASKKPNGEPYERPPYVNAANARVIATPESQRAALIPKLPPESLVYIVRKFPPGSAALYTPVVQEIGRRTTAIVRRCTRGLDKLSAEDVLSKVEIRILELVLTKEESRASDFLEIAFAQHVEARANDRLRHYLISPFGELRGYVAADYDEDGDEIERAVETIASGNATPEEFLLQLRDGNYRHQLLRKACKAIPDRQQLKAVVFHYGHGWPVESTDRKKPSIVRHFGIPRRTACRWLSDGLKAMQEALAEEINARKGEQR